MNLSMGIVLLWLAMAALWIAFHQTDAKTPWEAIQELAGKIGGGGGSDEGVEGEFVDPETGAPTPAEGD
jgi:hypothetical protein